MANSFVIILDHEYDESSGVLKVREIKETCSEAKAVAQLNPEPPRELNRSDFIEVVKSVSKEYEFKDNPGIKYHGAIYKLTF